MNAVTCVVTLVAIVSLKVPRIVTVKIVLRCIAYYVGTIAALTISMTIVVHQTVRTMTGEGLEALAPHGEWIALFSEGNLSCSSLSQRSDATNGDTVILDTDAA